MFVFVKGMAIIAPVKRVAIRLGRIPNSMSEHLGHYRH